MEAGLYFFAHEWFYLTAATDSLAVSSFQKVCVTVAALEQFFLMAAFCWMFIEGVYLYLFVVKVYNVTNKMKICHGVTWGKAIFQFLCLCVNKWIKRG